MNPLRKLKTISLVVIPLMLVWFAPSPTAQGQTPTPDMAVLGFNTADGLNALTSVTSGIYNSAFGFNALTADTTGSFNTAVGGQALKFLTTGSSNTAVGINTLVNNTSAIQNTAVGQGALHFNNANFNVATGYRALHLNTTGIGNTATGFQALHSNTIGFGNTACGFAALGLNTGHGNIGLGSEAGINLTTGNDNIDIANKGVAGDANAIRIGSAGFQTKTFIAGIRGITTVNAAIPVVIDTAGQLGTAPSSRRFKKDIKPMDKTSEALLSLKPVTFQYRSDKTGVPQFGLIAEEVAKINPDLVVRDDKGEIYTVRYDAVNTMLLNEFLKEHHQVQDLKAIVAAQQKQIEALTAGLQKVSAQIEVSKPAPQTVLNNQ
jgi:hypothetical protein